MSSSLLSSQTTSRVRLLMNTQVTSKVTDDRKTTTTARPMINKKKNKDLERTCSNHLHITRMRSFTCVGIDMCLQCTWSGKGLGALRTDIQFAFRFCLCFECCSKSNIDKGSFDHIASRHKKKKEKKSKGKEREREKRKRDVFFFFFFFLL